MMTQAEINRIIEEINGTSEKDRRANSKKRHDLYRDGGKRFLVEQILREFGQDALKEMRLAPINVLKKIIDKRAQVYKRAPIRTAKSASDQKLIDYYTEAYSVNQIFQKANRYYSLFSNTQIYQRPMGDKYLFWTDEEQFTTDSNGEKIRFDVNAGPEQWLNPILRMPITNITKDRDNEAWAKQGEDMVDVTMAFQMGWTDLLTIAKHQGFAIMTIIGEEEPKRLEMGINRGIFLRQRPDGPAPKLEYVSGNSPLEEYKNILMELLSVLLTSNDLQPSAIAGQGSGAKYNSGFQALIEMSDNLQAIEMDKPVFKKAELDFWDVLSRWHNWMFDQGVLNDEAKALGKFSDKIELQVIYPDVKPLESEEDVVKRIKELREEGLISRMDAMKKLNPELTDKQIEQKLEEIDNEAKLRAAAFGIPTQEENQNEEPEEPEEQEEEVQSEE